MLHSQQAGDCRLPEDVGILAAELYFPRQCVKQQDLEAFDGVPSGKYTIGLGQQSMGFCSDREDVNSICLTVVHRLLNRYAIDVLSIGRLEVGTESGVDKSKSVKSVLMCLFESSGCTDIEGVDCTNACFGGTQALFNAVNWIESSSWDGRYALVVMGDIAVYAAGAARPTGGAGALALLIGPNAPLIFDRGMRAHHMQHVYDFYKPVMSSEYPQVDGQFSLDCYLKALETCFMLYRKKAAGKPCKLSDFSGIVFHTPYCKLVQKSHALLVFLDYCQSEHCQAVDKTAANGFYDNNSEQLQHLCKLDRQERNADKQFWQHATSFSKAAFDSQTVPTLLFARELGNMYTPSLYAGLLSILINKPVDSLLNQRLLLFSYGSGLASCLFSLSITSNEHLLNKLISSIRPFADLLEQRKVVSPADFVSALSFREKMSSAAPFIPNSSLDSIWDDSFYLAKIDEKHRRNYALKKADSEEQSKS